MYEIYRKFTGNLKLHIYKSRFSFIPSHITVLGGNGPNLKILNEVNLNQNVRYEKPLLVLGPQKEYMRTIHLKMDRMIQGGKDCMIRGLQIHATTQEGLCVFL